MPRHNRRRRDSSHNKLHQELKDLKKRNQTLEIKVEELKKEIRVLKAQQDNSAKVQSENAKEIVDLKRQNLNHFSVDETGSAARGRVTIEEMLGRTPRLGSSLKFRCLACTVTKVIGLFRDTQRATSTLTCSL